MLTFHHTALWFSSHINIFFQRHLRVSCPLRDISEGQGHSLTQPQYSYQNQGLNTDEVHVPVSPTVPVLSFGAILFSVPGTPGLGVESGYCVSRGSLDLNSSSVSFMTHVSGVQAAA